MPREDITGMDERVFDLCADGFNLSTAGVKAWRFQLELNGELLFERQSAPATYRALIQFLIDGYRGNDPLAALKQIKAEAAWPVIVTQAEKDSMPQRDLVEKHYGASCKVTVDFMEYYLEKNMGVDVMWGTAARRAIDVLDPGTALGKYRLHCYRVQDSRFEGSAGHRYPSKLLDELVDLIKNGQRQIILTGAPGTGKTYTALKLVEYFHEASHVEKGAQYEFVQFHPSYDYTDFVEGLRPVDVGGTMQFRRVDGIFKAFCRKIIAQCEPAQLYFFLIDEINRADLSKVFGELMFSLESDKRGIGHLVQTQYANLPTHNISREDDCFKRGFYIPENLVVIGTMNDIDRSVESMDFALRRRFLWKEAVVDAQMLTAAFVNGGFFSVIPDETLRLEVCTQVAGRVCQFNSEMHGTVSYLNRHYDISQGQFSGIPDPNRDCDRADWIAYIMDWVWKYRVGSLLAEYLRGDSAGEGKLSQLKQAWNRAGTEPPALDAGRGSPR